MIWLELAAEAVTWSAWLWRHRQVFEPVLRHLDGVGDFAQAVLANPDGAVRRVGNLLVFGTPDGGQQVLAFIEQTAPRIETIERAVGGLAAGQATLSSSLASLLNVSMVSLGLTALTPAVLAVQYVALSRRLGEMQKLIVGLHKKFDAAVNADLKTGLELLRLGHDFLAAGDRATAHSRLNAGLPLCLRTKEYFGELLAGELNQGTVNLDEVRLLSRYLAVAIDSVASCQIALEQDQHAFSRSGHELDLLRRAARAVFHATVARDPAPYLLPPMREHGVTIDLMAKLFQQARDAGALDPAADTSAAAWFEDHRAGVVSASTREPFFSSKKKWYDGLRTQFQGAVATVEETNRVVGLARLVETVRASGGATRDVMERHRQYAAGLDPDTSPFAAWAFRPAAPAGEPSGGPSQ